MKINFPKVTQTNFFHRKLISTKEEIISNNAIFIKYSSSETPWKKNYFQFQLIEMKIWKYSIFRSFLHFTKFTYFFAVFLVTIWNIKMAITKDKKSSIFLNILRNRTKDLKWYGFNLSFLLFFGGYISKIYNFSSLFLQNFRCLIFFTFFMHVKLIFDSLNFNVYCEHDT